MTFTGRPDERRYWSSAARNWTLDATTDVWVGGDSRPDCTQLTVTVD